MSNTIKDLQAEAHAIARDKGWWDDDAMDANSIAAKLALIHSEVSEALECVRDGQLKTFTKKDRYENNKPEGLPTELADVVIRVMDLCSAMNIDLGAAIGDKMAFNRTRKHRHGGRAL